MNMIRPVAKLLILAALITGVALAEFIDFGIFPPGGGSISYAGGAAPLVGTGISVDTVIGIGTPVNSGVMGTCIACFLNFSTGSLASIVNLGPVMLYSFFGGGSIDIYGTVDFGGGNTVTGTLLSGVFQSNTPTLIQIAIPAIGGASNTFGPSTFSSNLNSGLTSFYSTPGAPPTTYAGLINLSFFSTIPTTSGGAFSSIGIGSGDVIASTPEPISIILLGTTLVLCGTVWRRRMMRS
jgi:hypothetical protein